LHHSGVAYARCIDKRRTRSRVEHVLDEALVPEFTQAGSDSVRDKIEAGRYRLRVRRAVD
jgi:hypothetical protein